MREETHANALIDAVLETPLSKETVSTRVLSNFTRVLLCTAEVSGTLCPTKDAAQQYMYMYIKYTITVTPRVSFLRLPSPIARLP